MTVGAFGFILSVTAVVSFVAYLMIGYFYLKKQENEYFTNLYGSLWKERLNVAKTERKRKSLIKDRNFQQFIGVIALITVATIVTVATLSIVYPLFPNFSLPVSTIGSHTGEEYAALFGGVLLVGFSIYVWRKRREA